MNTGSIDETRRYHRETTLTNWANGGEIMHYVFLHMPEFFHHAYIHRTGPISTLEDVLDDRVGNFPVETRLGAMTLDEYVRHPESTVDGVVVLRGGTIAYEAYPRMRPFDKHLLMSVSKPFASTLIAMLEDRGLIGAASPVETYLPELAGSGWEGVSVLDVLDMASGIDCREWDDDAYTNPEHPYYGFEASLGWNVPNERTFDDTYAYMATLRRRIEPGTVFEYTSANTFLLAWLVERITGLPFTEAVRGEIWSRIGAESDALIATSRAAAAPSIHGGISATLRDVARFGLLFTPSWQVVSQAPVISDAYLVKIQQPRRATSLWSDDENRARIERSWSDDPPSHNAYHWDLVWPDGDFYKGGYGGQGLYISPSRDLVVAFFGAANEDLAGNELPAISRRLAVRP